LPEKLNKTDRIFIGLANIANVHENFCKAFKSVGLNCDSYVWSTDANNFYTDEVARKLFLFDVLNPPFLIFRKNIFHTINKVLKWYHFAKIIWRYNVFMFVSQYTFDTRHISLKILNRLGKKVIFLFVGCVERDVEYDKTNPDYICNNCLSSTKQRFCNCKNLELKREKVQNIEKYCHFILGQPDISSYVNDKSKVVWFFLPYDYSPDREALLRKYDYSKLKIVHLPSNKEVKQTHVISPILEKIKLKYNVDIIVKDELWEQKKITDTLQEAHILINSIGTGYNMTAVEAMARGTVVLNSHPEWFKKWIPDAPIVHITQKSLEETLGHLIQNRSILKKYAINSINFYTKYHSLKSVGEYYKKRLKLI
jgi:hypothetical protein